MRRSHSLYIGQPTNSIAAKLLQAAAEFVGGKKQLAVRIDIAQSWLHKLMAARYHISDLLLLQTLDIVLTHRYSLIQVAATRPVSPGGDSRQ